MADIGSWGGHTFKVTPQAVMSFKDMTIKGESETEDKAAAGDKYVSRKNGKPTQINLTVVLSAALNNDVRKEALALVDEAKKGKTGYFYMAGSKLVPYQLMLTSASVEETHIAGAGVWVYAAVKLILKQSTLIDGTTVSTSSGGGGSGSSSQTYEVQISGMGIMTVTATSYENAMSKAGVSSPRKFTVYVRVKGAKDWKTYPAEAKPSTVTTAASAVAGALTAAVKTVVKTAATTVKNATTTSASAKKPALPSSKFTMIAK